ncbi:TdeIII family type II restriction endonuclease [Enterovibrio sp. FF113]|uniref:TdeIII family type II restriction endonuclease n=1 Tax=Enterovibrio sp. FF113 TaxID=3230010 RepID=UPI00352DAA00
MLTEQGIGDIIENTVSKNFHCFFDGKEVKVTHLLDHIFPRERKIRSLIGGLETSMGTRVWEPIAKAFAEGNAYHVLDEDDFFNQSVPIIPEDVLKFISLWEAKKIKDPHIPLHDSWLDVCEYVDENIDVSGLEYQKIPKGQGVDVILVRDNEFYFFDIKTNQINVGGGPKFLKNFIYWYTYLALMGIRKPVFCYLAFPFDPHKGSFWMKEKGKVSPLIPSREALVGNEFWDKLTGVNDTTHLIELTFKRLGTHFGEQFLHHFE